LLGTAGSHELQGSETMSWRARVAALVALITVVVGIARFLLPEGRAPERQAADEARAASSSRNTPDTAASPRRDAQRIPSRPAPADPRADAFIDAVEVDKTEVCRGEEVTVTMRVRTALGADRHLRCGAVERPELRGCKFTLHPEASMEEGALRVFARAQNQVTATADVPAILVKDCSVAHRLSVDVKRSLSAPDRVVLSAKIASSEGMAFEPVSFTSDFGDGRTETSHAPQVEHSYENRPQNTRRSYFMVNVKARSARGDELGGSRTIEFVNLGFAALERERRVVIFSSVKDDGQGGERIWLYHGAPFPVQIERVIVKTDSAAKLSDPRLATEYDARALLGFTELRPGESRELPSLARHAPAAPDKTHIVELKGRAAGGHSASGAFTLVYRSAPAVALSAPNETNEGEEE
jgi:hypothetical protein